MSARTFVFALFLGFSFLVTGCGSEETDTVDDLGSERVNADLDTTASGAPIIRAAEFDLKDYRGDVVLLNFWATWCAPCRAEMPDLVQIQEELRGEGLQIIGVAMDQEGKKVVAPFVARRPLNYPIVTDPQGKIGEEYGGIPALPTTLLIGRDGEVRQRIVGRVRLEQLRERLAKILDAAPPAADSTSQAKARLYPSEGSSS